MVLQPTTVALLLCILGAASCSSCKDDDGQPGADAASTRDATRPAGDASKETDRGAADLGAPAACATGKQVVTFSTDDSVKLAADLYLTGSANAAAAVLLHMVPPGNTRKNYPASFIDALTQRGIAVLNVDRRGAGESEGVAKDAYTGPNGKLDAKAAHDFLAAHACSVDTQRLIFVGASNGTTTALDFTVHAASDAALPQPAGLVFLTGGTYTESQNKIADHRALLDKLPILWVYSTAERQWSAAFESGAPTTWTFMEYDGGDHGTLMFGAKPKSITDVADFVAGVAKKT